MFGRLPDSPGELTWLILLRNAKCCYQQTPIIYRKIKPSLTPSHSSHLLCIEKAFASLISTAAAYLPKIKTNGSNVIILVKFVILLVLGIVNFWVNPLSFVVRIVNLLGFPFSLREKKGTEKSAVKKIN